MQPAQAAGLGRLSVLSALGQPLRAELDVTSASREETASMTARLAPAEAFRLAGLDYSPLLSTLRFSLATRADGRSVIRITSHQPVDEPVVDLLVELNWASGRLVRKYTFLLDPPEIKLEQRAIARGSVAADSAVPVAVDSVAPVAVDSVAPVAVDSDTRPAAPPRATTPARVAARTAGQPADARPATAQSDNSSAASTRAAAARAAATPPTATQPPATQSPVARSVPNRPAQTDAPTAAAQPAPTGASATAPGTVVVREGETIATVANRSKPATVHIDQAIIALYRANPSAFFGSVHLLKAGATLTVPDEPTMASVDRIAARNEIRGIRGSRESARPAEAPSASAAAAAEPSRASAPQSTPEPASPPAAPSSAELLRAARARITELERTVDALRKEVDQADLRIAELQKQLPTGATPPASGAAAQPAATATASSGKAPATAAAATAAPAASAPTASAPAASAPAASAPAASAPTASAPTVSTSTPSTAAPSSRAAPAAAVASPSASVSSVPSPATPSSAAVASSSSTTPAPAAPSSSSTTSAPSVPTSSAPTESAPAPAAPAGSSPAAPASGAASSTPAAPQAAPATGDKTLVDDLLAEPAVPVGGAALLAALIAGLAYRARRRKKTTSPSASPTGADEEPVNSLFGTTAHDDFDANVTTATRDSDAAFHSTEIDPVSEAEVYVAYGRQSQAEEILRNALREHPERQPVRLRLMELLAAREDRAGFAALADEMFGMGGGRNEEWPKAVTLGLMVDPDNPVYTGKAKTSDASISTVKATGGAVRTEHGSVAPEQPAAAQPAQDLSPPPDLEWTPDNLPGTATEPAVATGPATPPEHALDFVSTPIADGAPESTTPGLAAEGQSEPTADMTLSQSELDVPLAFELPASIEIAAPTVESNEPEASAEGEESELMVPPTLTFDAPETNIVSPMSDRKRREQFDTALELALAYHELGDKEGVREMLRDVLESGSDAQKLKARQILSKAESATTHSSDH